MGSVPLSVPGEESESNSSISMRCFAFLTFSGFGSDEAGEVDNNASRMGENMPRLGSFGDSNCA